MKNQKRESRKNASSSLFFALIIICAIVGASYFFENKKEEGGDKGEGLTELEKIDLAWKPDINNVSGSFSEHSFGKYYYLTQNTKNAVNVVIGEGRKSDENKRETREIVGCGNRIYLGEAQHLSAVALFPKDNKKVVCVNDEGLMLYDLETREKELLVSETKDLEKDVDDLGQPLWSQDGRYVALTQIHHDGHLSCGIFDVQQKKYFHPKTESGDAPRCLNMVWGDNNILASFDHQNYDEDNKGGVYLIGNESFGEAVDISQKMDVNADFYGGSFSSDGSKLVVTYIDDYSDDDTTMSLAVFDFSGNKVTKIDKKNEKSSSLFSDDGSNVYVVEYYDDKSFLVKYGVSEKTRDIILSLPDDFGFCEDLKWMGNKIVLFGRGYDFESDEYEDEIKFLIVNLEEKKVDFLSPSMRHFLGFSLSEHENQE